MKIWMVLSVSAMTLLQWNSLNAQELEGQFEERHRALGEYYKDARKNPGRSKTESRKAYEKQMSSSNESMNKAIDQRVDALMKDYGFRRVPPEGNSAPPPTSRKLSGVNRVQPSSKPKRKTSESLDGKGIPSDVVFGKGHTSESYKRRPKRKKEVNFK